MRRKNTPILVKEISNYWIQYSLVRDFIILFRIRKFITQMTYRYLINQRLKLTTEEDVKANSNSIYVYFRSHLRLYEANRSSG